MSGATISFLEFQATYVPQGESTPVVRAVPKQKDLVLSQQELEAFLNGPGSITRNLTLQDGKEFSIKINQDSTPAVHKALSRASEDNKSGSRADLTSNETFHAYMGPSGSVAPEDGSFSLLNGIFGISWD